MAQEYQKRSTSVKPRFCSANPPQSTPYQNIPIYNYSNINKVSGWPPRRSFLAAAAGQPEQRLRREKNDEFFALDRGCGAFQFTLAREGEPEGEKATLDQVARDCQVSES